MNVVDVLETNHIFLGRLILQSSFCAPYTTFMKYRCNIYLLSSQVINSDIPLLIKSFIVYAEVKSSAR